LKSKAIAIENYKRTGFGFPKDSGTIAPISLETTESKDNNLLLFEASVPAMPTICVCSSKLKHREKIPDVEHRFMQICVARSISKKEAAVTPEAMKAMDKEWDKLEKQAAWLIDKVREWKEVCQEAKANKTIVHR
jgi:hypothetical protein